MCAYTLDMVCYKDHFIGAKNVRSMHV
jgi:hypothetical protein